MQKYINNFNIQNSKEFLVVSNKNKNKKQIQVEIPSHALRARNDDGAY